MAEARESRYSCSVQHNEVESGESSASGVVAVHDELVRLVRQLVAGDGPPAGSPTFAQHSLLSYIARNPGCRATQISESFGVHRSTVSRQLRVCIDEGWVRAEAGGEGTILQIAGFALQRRDQFEEEFAKVVADIERSAGGGPPANGDAAPVGAGAGAGEGT